MNVPTRGNVASRYLGKKACKNETIRTWPAAGRRCANNDPPRRRLEKDCPGRNLREKEENGAGAPAESPSLSPGLQPIRPATTHSLRVVAVKLFANGRGSSQVLRTS